MKILCFIVVYALFLGSIKAKEGHFIKTNRYELTPEISGKLVSEGTPIAGAVIELAIGAMGDTRVHQSITDQNGSFYFDEVVFNKLNSLGVFDEQLVSVSIDTDIGDKNIKIWRTMTAGYRFKPFMVNNLSNLACDVNSDLQYFIFSIDGNDYEVHSVCDLQGSDESGKY
ncbi:carboxypeptidase regulatory-like domain-containing protein [Vibrio sp. S9_S30]|uniref:DUF6795 domain-containing protein n=1 Tax=Vibrio sp. S9_S30 TaxID=2720226 RepID=UPI001680C56A|nr:carboxypeptidase-like regulatory domain-containing protein [Vibrio sp. S9_S30]MBD1557700.1 carboxypeptidase regulatory-like domain-containing protein [Vibrio sp. S9_S30]